MNRIQSLFRQKNINNQPKISRRSQRRRNIAVKANCFVLNVLLSNILDFSPLFLAVVSRRAKGLEEDKSSSEEPTDAAATTAEATTTTTSNSSDGESPDEVPSSSASAIEGYVEDGIVASCPGSHWRSLSPYRSATNQLCSAEPEFLLAAADKRLAPVSMSRGLYWRERSAGSK